MKKFPSNFSPLTFHHHGGEKKLKTEIKGKFRGLKITVLSLFFLSVLAMTPVSYATNSSHIYAHGNWTITKTIISVNVAKDKTTIFDNFTKELTGTIKGSIVGIQVIYVYPNGTVSSRYAGVFTGTIGPSKMGTALVHARVAIVTTLEATISFSDGTGGLVGFKGSVESDAVSPFSTGNYAGILTT